jgi:hypothetical protein
MHVASLDGKELTRALRQMKSSPGKKLGSAFWMFGEELVIGWSGGEQRVSAEVHKSLPDGIVVDCVGMKHVVERLRYQGPTEIRFADGHMSMGNDRIRAELAKGPRAFALLVGSSAGDVLLASEAFSMDEARLSGYEEEILEVREKLHKSLRRAGRALDWTGISEDELNDAVMERIADKAQARKGRFLV